MNLLCLAATLLLSAPVEQQIEWLPDLAAARKVAEAEHRPLLIAVNMDGESASERIVREQYRDPEFVALTRKCVCLCASAFRHNPRDFDDDGKRILCPRLGGVTCGEHIALEPILFDAFLGGERIAPRHALIQPDGKKVFDEFLLFDLRELTQKLRDGVASAPTAPERPTRPRDLLETWRRETVKRLRAPNIQTPKILAALAASALKQGLGPGAGATFATILRDVKELPFAQLQQPEEGLLGALATVDGTGPATRSLLLAELAFGAKEAPAAVEAAFGAEDAAKIEAALASEGGPVDLNVVLNDMRAVRAQMKLEPHVSDVKRPIEELAVALKAATDALDAKPDDAAALAAVGHASLELARKRIEERADGSDILLMDADQFLNRAIAAQPDSVPVLLDLAKLAYTRGKFEEEEQYALQADLKLPALPKVQQTEVNAMVAALREPAERHEALRWVGDAAARLYGPRQGKDPAQEIGGIVRGARALLFAALSPAADEVDYESAASYCAMIGLERHAILVLDEGLARFPLAPSLRNALDQGYSRVGRPELAILHQQRVASQHPEQAEGPWWIGYARMLLAEWQRRQENPEAAVATYRAAQDDFKKTGEMNADFADSSRYWQAMCSLGIGFAGLLKQDQAAAADALAQAIALEPAVVSARDGLDREAMDLLDNALEYRIGRESPVDVAKLLAQLDGAEQGTAFWAGAIADSELREALRADGRHDEPAGDRYLAVAVDAAKRAHAKDESDDSDRITLAQCHTIFAERLLARGDVDAARPHLAAAAPLMGVKEPASSADRKALDACASELRGLLGDARPRFRPGR